MTKPLDSSYLGLGRASRVLPDFGRGMWRARSSPTRNFAPAEPAYRARRGDAMLCDRSVKSFLSNS